MFSNEKFIKASRKFVCIRIETFENAESERMVRELLNGRFANTSFCIFNPDGTEKLSRSGRSPGSSLVARRGRDGQSSDASVIAAMKKIASQYDENQNESSIVLQDFHSFRQALNVASADQRLLLVANVDGAQKESLKSQLRQALADDDIVGKFHLDFVDPNNRDWRKSVEGANSHPALTIVRSGSFGLEGVAMETLSVKVTSSEIKAALLDANEQFASMEERKNYGSHVTQGRRQGIFFENEIPYGEDRDGDGEVDSKNRSKRRRR